MPERLMEELAHEYLKDKQRHRNRTVVLAILCSVVAASTIGVGVTLFVTHQAKATSEARSNFNCVLQRESRIEGNKRVVYTQATRAIIKHFKPVQEWLKAKHPELYPLPKITLLPDIHCSDLPK